MSWQEELQVMVAAYDGNGTFVEFAERYLQEHPSQYDFSTAIKYVVIEPKRMLVQDWEESFDKVFYEGLYGCAESDGEYYDVFEAVKTFIRELLERSK